jgi:hypothetical protein
MVSLMVSRLPPHDALEAQRISFFLNLIFYLGYSAIFKIVEFSNKYAVAPIQWTFQPKAICILVRSNRVEGDTIGRFRQPDPIQSTGSP